MGVGAESRRSQSSPAQYQPRINVSVVIFQQESINDNFGRSKNINDQQCIGSTSKINLGKFHRDLTVLPHWESWLVREIIPFYGLNSS